MKAPDKIYLAAVEPRLNGYAGLAWIDAEDIIEPIEYIRKDALLEWAKECKSDVADDKSQGDAFAYGYTCALRELIDILEAL